MSEIITVPMVFNVNLTVSNDLKIAADENGNLFIVHTSPITGKVTATGLTGYTIPAEPVDPAVETLEYVEQPVEEVVDS